MSRFIETSRLYINVPTQSDIDSWENLHTDSECMKFLGGPRDHNTILRWLETDIAHFKKHGFGLGSVFEKEKHLFVGRAGLIHLHYDEKQKEIEIGYILQKNNWKKGYATELVKTLIEWGFSHLTVNRLVALTKPENIQSRCVLEKAGMHCEKKIRLEEANYLFFTVYRKRS